MSKSLLLHDKLLARSSGEWFQDIPIDQTQKIPPSSYFLSRLEYSKSIQNAIPLSNTDDPSI